MFFINFDVEQVVFYFMCVFIELINYNISWSKQWFVSFSIFSSLCKNNSQNGVKGIGTLKMIVQSCK